MSDIETKDDKPVSKKKLFGYFAAAYVGAGALLMAAVLPAEYGIDPLGIGEKLGIKQLSETGANRDTAALEAAVVTAPEGSFFKRDTPYQTKTITIKMEDLSEVEHKLLMEEGDMVVFEWAVKTPRSADEPSVYFDMHGHPSSDNKSEFPEDFVQSYETGEGYGRSGGFVAPFTGYHGLYLMNLEVGELEVDWTISGYWTKDIELYRTVDGDVKVSVEY